MWLVTAVAAATLLAFGVASALTGGFELSLSGVRISVRQPLQSLLIGSALAGGAALLARRDGAARRGAAWLVPAACAVVLFLVLMTRGAFVAGGADSSGYVSQAAMWERRSLHYFEPLVTAVEWENKRATLSPLGYRPSYDGASQVPTYPPGLPMLMAAGRQFSGEAGGYAVVPLLGLLLVAVTAMAAFQAGGIWASAFASVLVTLSPTFLHHVVQPMSDVPAACLWTLAMWTGWRARGKTGASGAGLLAAAAILVRPNLAPFGAIVVWLSGRGGTSPSRRTMAAAAAAATSVGVIVVAVLQWHLYGSPFTSGYGDLSVLFSASHVPTNVVRYTSWLAATEPFLLAGLAAPWLQRFPADRANRRLSVAAVAALVVALALYAFYLPFDNWTYLRFLQPAFPLLAVGSSVVLARLVARARPVAWAASVVLVALVASSIALARSHDALEPKRVTTRFRMTATYVNRYLPTNAVLVSVEHSGALRYYTGRSILRFDQLHPDLLDEAIGQLKNLGRPVYFILDDFEVQAVRQRFAGTSTAGRLDHLPRMVLRADSPVYVFDAQ